MVIGGFKHQTVNAAAKNFVMAAQKYLSKAKLTESTQSSDSKKIDFYFLTKTGRYYIEDDRAKIESGNSELTQLYATAHQVISEYRLVAGNQ